MYLFHLSLSFVVLGAQALQVPLSYQIEEKVMHKILSPRVDKFIAGVLVDWNSPAGLGVAVVQQNDDGSWIVETKGYGVATGDGKKVDANTMFAIGSNSKLFTVHATGLLIANESLGLTWDTKIASVIPEWGLMDTYASSESTILDLMSHRTGMPRDDGMYRKDDAIPAVLERLRHLRPSVPFRTTWQYNNNMYTALSYLPQLLVEPGLTIARYIKQHIFEPLGLNSTTYSSEVAEKSGNLAEGFGRDHVNKTKDVFDQGVPRPMPYWNPSSEDGNLISGAGGIIMSANDAALWLQTLLLEGKNPKTGDSVIPPEIIRKAATGLTVVSGTSNYPELSPIVYGGGQSRASYRGHEFIEHGGGTPGFLTQITRLPSDRLGIAVFSNDGVFGSMMMEIIKFRIMDEALALEPVDWNSRIKDSTRKAYESEEERKVSRPSSPQPPSKSFAELVGVYRNPGYGNLEFCLYWAKNNSCNAEISERIPGLQSKEVPQLISPLNGFFSTHVVLTHFDGDLFNGSVYNALPTNDPNQPYWGENIIGSGPYAEFDIDEDGNIGFGLRGGFWGAGNEVKSPLGKTVKERSEAWFYKV